MKASRGMGDIAPSKMPKAKTIVRKDNPNDVTMYKRGGKTKVKKMATTMPKRIERTKK
jgi:hypothetical protein